MYMIKSRLDYHRYLERDRISNGVKNRKNIFDKFKFFIFPKLEWSFIKAMRHLEYYENVGKYRFYVLGRLLYLFSKYRYRQLSIKCGYSIPTNVFGAGISLPHRGTLVINSQTKIGENCRIHVGVNIGAHKEKAPRIGNNVYIGPGAIIFGDIEIADNITIGANATVNKSFTTPNVTIAGTPAKI